jgi:arylsulfatase
MGRVVEFAQGFPGYDATIPKANGMLSEVLREAGYATFAVGKWHLTPAPERTTGASKQRWPLGRGFDRFYGFMAGETDQYHPDLARSFPILPDLVGRAAITPDVVREIVIATEGRAYRDPAAEQRAALATQ